MYVSNGCFYFSFVLSDETLIQTPDCHLIKDKGDAILTNAHF